MANNNAHNIKPKPATEEELDRVDAKLQEMGCLDQHYAVLECVADTKDWRKCQDQVNIFRQCYTSAEQ